RTAEMRRPPSRALFPDWTRTSGGPPHQSSKGHNCRLRSLTVSARRPLSGRRELLATLLRVVSFLKAPFLIHCYPTSHRSFPCRFSSPSRCSERRPSGCCSVISRTSSFGCADDDRRRNRVPSPLAYVRKISTVWASTRRDDWV